MLAAAGRGRGLQHKRGNEGERQSASSLPLQEKKRSAWPPKRSREQHSLQALLPRACAAPPYRPALQKDRPPHHKWLTHSLGLWRAVRSQCRLGLCTNHQRRSLELPRVRRCPPAAATAGNSPAACAAYAALLSPCP